MENKFELGKCYVNDLRGKLHVLCTVDSYNYGISLIVEDKKGRLYPIDMNEDKTDVWKEISKKEFEEEYSRC
jgi:hypothetical protein